MRDKPLDSIDQGIVNELRRDVLLSNVALAQRLDVSTATIASRIRSLVEDRVMIPTVQRDMRWAGYELLCFIDIYVGKRSVVAVAEDLRAMNDIAVVCLLMGGASIRLHVFAQNQRSLVEQVLTPISQIPGIARVVPNLMLQSLKYATDIGLIRDIPQATGHDSMSIDERIVDILSKDARIGNREVARQLDISESQVRGRLKRLQDEKRIHIGLMLDAVGAAEFHVISYIRLTIEPVAMNEALKPLLALVNVTSMYYVSGSYNVLLIVGFGSLAEMGDFTSRYLRSDIGVLEVSIEQITGCLKHRYELISMQD